MWKGSYEESLTYFNKAVAVRIRTMTFCHPSVAVSLSKIGLAYFAMEQLDKSLGAFERALEIRKTYPNSGNLEIAKLCNNIAIVHYHKGDKKVALKYFKKALFIMKRFIEGPVRRESLVYDVSMILSNMGKIYLEKKSNDKACSMFEEALLVSLQLIPLSSSVCCFDSFNLLFKIQTLSFKKNHNCVLDSLGNIAFAKDIDGQTILAIQVSFPFLLSSIYFIDFYRVSIGK